MTRTPNTIIAVTTEDDSHRPVIDRAASLAAETKATVILYDLDADMGPLESPLPTAWSGDGEEEQFSDRLAPQDLEAAGRSRMADQVRMVRAAGLDAFGWLPAKADADTLVQYATKQRADLVLVSADDAEILDALRSGSTGGADDDGDGARVRVEAVTAS
jgi:hypothetical protein